MQAANGTRATLLVPLCVAMVTLASNTAVLAQTAPSYFADPSWPAPLPNNWKFGGITGLSVDQDGNIWVLNRPHDLADLELLAEIIPPVSECCVRPPAMIHLDRSGNVIGSFDAAPGHGMDVDDDGYVYIGQDTVRKYDPNTGQVVAEVARTPEREGGGRVGLPPPMDLIPGRGTVGPVYRFLPRPPRPVMEADPAEQAREAAAMTREIGHQTGKFTLADSRGDLRDGVGERRIVAALRQQQQRIAGGVHCLGGGTLVHDVEMRREAGFERKPSENGFAE